MMRCAWTLLLPLMSSAANYTAERLTVDGLEVLRLADAAAQAEVSIVPSLGNNSYEMKVKGQPVFWSPYQTLAEFRAKPAHLGNPFLAPWANRIDGLAYWANGKRYLLNPELANFRLDNHKQPIHGLLVYAKEWKVNALKATADSAAVTSRIEFWRRPDWMAQFPFAHTIEMTYRLRSGVLEVHTKVENLSSETMPLSLGYHPYFRLASVPRDDWKIHIPARSHVVLGPTLVPTGEIKPASLADPFPLSGAKLDDVFTDLVRNSRGEAEFWVEGGGRKISVVYGPKYDVAVVYAPAGRDFVCFEPMVGVTNVFNLAQAGKYNRLQSIPPGGTWTESFWIKTSGY
jgi:aldose 1-epimerase